LNLVPVVAQHAKDLGKSAVTIDDDAAEADYLFETTWVLLSADSSVFRRAEFDKAADPARTRAGLRPWTDDYSNLFQIVK
jgi:hypothetical protein